MNEQTANNGEQQSTAGQWVAGLFGAGVGGFGAKAIATQSEAKSSEVAKEFINNSKKETSFTSVKESLNTLTNKEELHTEAEEWFKKQSEHYKLAGEAEALKQKINAYEGIPETSLYHSQKTLADRSSQLSKEGAETFDHPLVKKLLTEHCNDTLHQQAKQYFEASKVSYNNNTRMREIAPKGLRPILDDVVEKFTPINEKISEKINEIYPEGHTAYNTANKQQSIIVEEQRIANMILNEPCNLNLIEAEIDKTTHLKNVPDIRQLYAEQYKIANEAGLTEYRSLSAEITKVASKISETKGVLNNLGVTEKLDELVANGVSSYQEAAMRTIEKTYLETPNMQAVKSSFEHSVDAQKHLKTSIAATDSLKEAERLENSFISKLKNAIKYSKVAKIPGGVGTVATAGAIALGTGTVALYSALSEKSHAERVLSGSNKNTQHTF